MDDNRVLVRAVVSDCGNFVRLAPGVEVPLRSVDVAAELPPEVPGLGSGLVLLFENDDDREDFARQFMETPAVDAVKLI